MSKNETNEAVLGAVILFGGIGVAIVGLMLAWPQYNVYSSRLAGQAKLAEAEASRQIVIQEAIAKNTAAKELGQADLTRATYQAEAAKTLSNGLTKEYLQYLSLLALGDKDGPTVIYVPTNGLITPQMLETGRAPTIGKAKTIP